jgi:dihydrofolate reductase
VITASLILSNDYGIDDNGKSLIFYNNTTRRWFNRSISRNAILVMGHNAYKELFDILPSELIKYVITNNEINYDKNSFKVNISDAVSWLHSHSHVDIHIVGGYYIYMTYWEFVDKFYIAKILDKKIDSNIHIMDYYMDVIEDEYYNVFNNVTNELDLRIVERNK